VERRAVAAFYRSASSIQADRLVAVTCRAAGKVRTVAVEEGDWTEATRLIDLFADHFANEALTGQLRQRMNSARGAAEDLGKAAAIWRQKGQE